MSNAFAYVILTEIARKNFKVIETEICWIIPTFLRLHARYFIEIGFFMFNKKFKMHIKKSFAF